MEEMDNVCGPPRPNFQYNDAPFPNIIKMIDPELEDMCRRYSIDTTTSTLPDDFVLTDRRRQLALRLLAQHFASSCNNLVKMYLRLNTDDLTLAPPAEVERVLQQHFREFPSSSKLRYETLALLLPPSLYAFSDPVFDEFLYHVPKEIEPDGPQALPCIRTSPRQSCTRQSPPGFSSRDTVNTTSSSDLSSTNEQPSHQLANASGCAITRAPDAESRLHGIEERLRRIEDDHVLEECRRRVEDHNILLQSHIQDWSTQYHQREMDTRLQRLARDISMLQAYRTRQEEQSHAAMASCLDNAYDRIHGLYNRIGPLRGFMDLLNIHGPLHIDLPRLTEFYQQQSRSTAVATTPRIPVTSAPTLLPSPNSQQLSSTSTSTNSSESSTTSLSAIPITYRTIGTSPASPIHVNHQPDIASSSDHHATSSALSTIQSRLSTLRTSSVTRSTTATSPTRTASIRSIFAQPRLVTSPSFAACDDSEFRCDEYGDEEYNEENDAAYRVGLTTSVLHTPVNSPIIELFTGDFGQSFRAWFEIFMTKYGNEPPYRRLIQLVNHLCDFALQVWSSFAPGTRNNYTRTLAALYAYYDDPTTPDQACQYFCTATLKPHETIEEFSQRLQLLALRVDATIPVHTRLDIVARRLYIGLPRSIQQELTRRFPDVILSLSQLVSAATEINAYGPTNDLAITRSIPQTASPASLAESSSTVCVPITTTNTANQDYFTSSEVSSPAIANTANQNATVTAAVTPTTRIVSSISDFWPTNEWNPPTRLATYNTPTDCINRSQPGHQLLLCRLPCHFCGQTSHCAPTYRRYNEITCSPPTRMPTPTTAPATASTTRSSTTLAAAYADHSPRTPPSTDQK